MFDVAPVLDADPACLSQQQALSALAECERLTAMLAGRAYALIRRVQQGWAGELMDGAPEEVAIAQRVSPQTARLRIAAANRFGGVLAAAGEDLSAGRISTGQAIALESETQHCSDAVTAKVQQLILPALPGMTPGVARLRIRRAVLSVDAEGAANRYARAHRDRAVYKYTGEDGMGEITGVLSADRVAEAWESVHAYARTFADERTMDQKRADALYELLTGLPAGVKPTPAAADQLPPAPDDVPWPLEPSGEDTPWPVDAVPPGVTPPDGEPLFDPDRPLPEPPADEEWLPVRRLVASPGPRAVSLHLLADLPTVLGLAHHPGQLAGYGPIPAPLVRMLAADAAWQRLLTDPVSGAAIDLGRRRYRPTAALADFIRARDAHCRFPGCLRRRVDVDHDRPWARGGTTDRHQLIALCRRHHRLKTVPTLVLLRPPRRLDHLDQPAWAEGDQPTTTTR